MEEQNNIIIYKTKDGKSSIALYAKDGNVWLNQHKLHNFLPPQNKQSAIT